MPVCGLPHLTNARVSSLCRAYAAQVHLAAPRPVPGVHTEHLHRREPHGALAAVPQPRRERRCTLRRRRLHLRSGREAVAEQRRSRVGAALPTVNYNTPAWSVCIMSNLS
jgi:hypothetical protein